MTASVYAALILILIASVSASFAHENQPLHIAMTETARNTVIVQWRVPESVPAFNAPTLTLPPTCTALDPEIQRRTVHRQTFACAGTFQGDVAIRYPIFNPAVTTLIRLVRQSGEQYTAVLGPHENTWTIPAPEARDGVVREYLGLGIRHILEGYDHLLFLGCLIFIAQTWRRILFAVTGFTVAHSLTLVLAALQLVHLPIPPVEAVIALSIVFLAREICLNRHDTLTVRYPIAVSSTFGLLHGFGFAAVLREIGLPQTELPFALLFFNLGVEIGQLLFIGTLIGLWLALRLVSHRVNGLTTETLLHHLRLPVGYVCGVVSSYWFLTRFARF